MKKTCAIIGIFVFTFAFAASGFISTDAQAKPPRNCLYDLPCAPEDIICNTGELCWGTCYPQTMGGVFYCEGDTTQYCSKDYYYPVPCEL